MRVCVVCTTENKRGYTPEPVKIASLGAAEIYKTEILKNGGKRRFLREIKKCAKRLREGGIGICAVEEELAVLSHFGITALSCPKRVYREPAASMLNLFVEWYGLCGEVLLCGGSISFASETACELLKSRKSLYIRNAGYESIAEEVSARTGTVVRREGKGEYIRMHLDESENFIGYKEMAAKPEDFRIILPEGINEKVPYKTIPQLAEILEISGFLKKNEIKVEYFPK